MSGATPRSAALLLCTLVAPLVAVAGTSAPAQARRPVLFPASTLSSLLDAVGGGGGTLHAAAPRDGSSAAVGRFAHVAEEWLSGTVGRFVRQHAPEPLLQAMGALPLLLLLPDMNNNKSEAGAAHGGGGGGSSSNRSFLLGRAAETATVFGRQPVPASFWRHPETLVVAPGGRCIVPPSYRRSNRMTLMSGGNRDPHSSHAQVITNHRAFAERHGYTYWWHRGSKVAEKGWQPYWSKIAMLRERMERYPDNDAYIWVDDDIVLTNHRVDMFARALADHPRASVLVTADARPDVTQLNTGIIIVRNNAEGRGVLDEMWRRAGAGPRSSDGISVAHAPQSQCLHEQEVLAQLVDEQHARRQAARLAPLCSNAPLPRMPGTNNSSAFYFRVFSRINAAPIQAVVDDDMAGVHLSFSGLRVSSASHAETVEARGRVRDAAAAKDAAAAGSVITVLAQRTSSFNLNTFLRWSHFDPVRGLFLRYDADRSSSKWRRGDFAGHCTYARHFHPLLSILTEIHLCHTCSCHEILRMESPGQGAVAHPQGAVHQSLACGSHRVR
jgi:hypothetical protein